MAVDEFDEYDDIKEVLRVYHGRNVKDIFEQAAPLAAALIVEIATGGIPAKTSDRLMAARNVIDRVAGTPVGLDVMEAKKAADAMIERIERIERGRATMEPV